MKRNSSAFARKCEMLRKKNKQLTRELDKLRAFVQRIAEGIEHEPLEDVYLDLVKQAQALLAESTP